MNAPLLAKIFACPDPSRMDWIVEDGLAQCEGCPAHCGKTVTKAELETLWGIKPEPQQTNFSFAENAIHP